MACTLVGMGVVLGAFGGLMTAVRTYQRRCSPHPELVRKLLHVGMGLVALTLPWLFESAAQAFALAGLFIVLLVALRTSKRLEQRLGGVLNAVQRESWGEIYFAMGVSTVFLLSAGDRLLFCTPILILALADAAAALVGLHYGRVCYWSGGRKTIEGSAAFFLVSFLCTHVALLLFTQIGRAETILSALMISVLLTPLEAVSRHGFDNLLIPLGSFVLLKTYLGMDSSALAASLGIAVGLLTAAFCSRHWILRSSTVVRAIFLAILGWAFTAVVRLFFLVLSLVAYGVFFSREAVQGRGKT